MPGKAFGKMLHLHAGAFALVQLGGELLDGWMNQAWSGLLEQWMQIAVLGVEHLAGAFVHLCGDANQPALQSGRRNGL
jgi:hypothetical protein